MTTESARVWFSQELETTATFWRLMRRDGVTLGFTTHDTDLWFDGVMHRAAPGMLPSAVRRSAGFEADSAEVQGALSHDSIGTFDLAIGRFDGARVLIGVVDWESVERHVIYRGSIGSVTEEAGAFTADLVSRKAELARDPVPRTSPSCRAVFCGPGCTLAAARFTHGGSVVSFEASSNAVTIDTAAPIADFSGGTLRWLGGPYAGQATDIVGSDGTRLVLATPLDSAPPAGTRVLLREGCDHTNATCADRFANAINFQGEPFLPGNDLITRYPVPGP